MSKKLRCSVTGNFSYVNDERWNKLVAKFDSEEDLKTNYVSRLGKRVLQGEPEPETYKNKVRCIVTGELRAVSKDFWARLIKRHGSEEAVRENYISRIAKQLRKQGKSDQEIREMAEQGNLPEAAPQAKKAPRAKKADKKSVVVDTVPEDVKDFLQTPAEHVA